MPTSPESWRPRLVMRADCSTEIGVGHMMRCFALGQAWQRHGGVAEFLSMCGTKTVQDQIVSKGVGFTELPARHPHPADQRCTLNRVSQLSSRESRQPWLVLDGYHFDTAYQRELREADCRVLVIDDQANLPFYHAEVLLNQNAAADGSAYRCDPGTDLLLGTRYALLRPDFHAWRPDARRVPPVASKLLVTLGGGDPANVTGLVAEQLTRLDVDALEIAVVVGPANPHATTLENLSSGLSGPHVRIIRDPQNMPELLAWADLAVCGAGSTCWEIAYLGVPAVIIILADNQRAIAAGMAELGAAISAGWFQDLDPAAWAAEVTALIHDQDRRQRMTDVGQGLVDGVGAERVVAHLRKSD